MVEKPVLIVLWSIIAVIQFWNKQEASELGAFKLKQKLTAENNVKAFTDTVLEMRAGPILRGVIGG